MLKREIGNEVREGRDSWSAGGVRGRGVSASRRARRVVRRPREAGSPGSEQGSAGGVVHGPAGRAMTGVSCCARWLLGCSLPASLGP